MTAVEEEDRDTLTIGPYKYQPIDIETFLMRIRDGAGEITTGYELGWAPDKTVRLIEDKEFAELLFYAKEMLYESIEVVVARKAKAGSRWAAEMMLFTHAKHRGWVPPRQQIKIEKHTTASHTITLSVKEAVGQLFDEYGIEALQPGGPLDAIEAAVRDDDDA